MKSLLISCLLFLIPLLAWAAPENGSFFRFADPGIPNNETITYRSTVDGTSETITEKVTVKYEGGKDIYEFYSSSPSLELTLRLERTTMAMLSARTMRTFSDEAAFDSNFTVLRQKENDREDEIKVPHFIGLRYLFRGYPFDKPRKIKINYYTETQKKQFPMSVKYKIRETIRVMGRSIDCHVLEFGLDGFWATFLTKQKLWYTVDPPHYMVRYQGPESFPGSPERIMELTDYKVP